MAMTRAQFRRELERGLNTVFGMEYKRYSEQWRQVFPVEMSEKAYEEDVLLAGFGGAPVKAEGSGVAYDTGGESYTARYLHETIALAFALSEEAEEDGLYGKIGAKYAKALARSLQHTKEIKGAGILNSGFDSDHTGGDGKALFAADHPLWGGGVQSNVLATPSDLSEASLEEILIGISEFTDERGIPVAAMAKKLVVPPQLQFVSDRLLMSQWRPGTADNDVNAIKNMGSIPGGASVNQHLVDPTAFFVTTDIPDGLKHFVRKKVQRGVEGDFETGNQRYKARERYSFGWSDYRGVYASQGGGA